MPYIKLKCQTGPDLMTALGFCYGKVELNSKENMNQESGGGKKSVIIVKEF